MSKLIGAATVCKCGSAIWRSQKAKERIPCALFPGQCTHDFEYVCNKCDKLLQIADATKAFCPTDANLLQWTTCFPNLQIKLGFAVTHLVCACCSVEDRNICYDWLSAQKNLWLPKWQVKNYYGITNWGKNGAGPWSEEFVFCAKCANRKDLADWLKKQYWLVLLKEGRASPHKFSELAKEMEKNFSRIPLLPSPWG